MKEKGKGTKSGTDSIRKSRYSIFTILALVLCVVSVFVIKNDLLNRILLVLIGLSMSRDAWKEYKRVDQRLFFFIMCGLLVGTAVVIVMSVMNYL
jgi:cell division protein FtsW (lipid II flippase)